MFWRLQFFPRCAYHVFLSHCREDMEWLIDPLYEALRQKAIILERITDLHPTPAPIP